MMRTLSVLSTWLVATSAYAQGFGQAPHEAGGDAGWTQGSPGAQPESGTVFNLRMAFPVAGGGEMDSDCDGDLCGDVSSGDDDYDEDSGVALGGDVLVRMGPSLRLGGGLLYELDTEIEDGGDADLGTDLSLFGIVEGIFPAGGTVSFAARAFAGFIILFPGGDLEDMIDDLHEICDSPYAFADDCDVDGGPFLGFTLGGGGGLLVALEGVTLRFDLLFQFYSVPLLGARIEQGSDHAEMSTTATGTRFFLAGGAEL